MRTNLIFEFPTLDREADAKEYIDEFYAHNSNIDGSGGLDGKLSYKDWVKKTNDYYNGVNIDSAHVPATTYFAVAKSNNTIVGMVNIRHELSDFLKNNDYGHIGYSVRPTQRRKGYATTILAMAIKECIGLKIDTIHIGCNENNIGSKRTIEKNGGVLYRKLDDNGIPSLEYTVNIKGK